MDYIFLLQVLLVYLFWLLVRYFYRHSDWLHSNKPVVIDIPRFPRLSNFIEKHFNNDGPLFTVFVIVVGLPAFFGGVILLYIIAQGAAHELDILLSRFSWWQQVLIWFCIILFYFGVRIWWNGKRKSRNKSN